MCETKRSNRRRGGGGVAFWVLCAAVWGFCGGPGRAAAQTDVGAMFAPYRDQSQMFEEQDDAAFLNEGHTRKDNYRLGLDTVESQGRYRLINTYPINPTIGYDAFYLNIHTNDPRLPRKEWDTSVAFGSPISKIGEKGFVAAIIGVGYAGDVPFSQGDAYYGKATLLVGEQIDEKTRLIFALDYNGNRTTLPDVPVPGVVYSKEVSSSLSYSVGFPYSSVEWKPMPQVTLNLDYSFPETIAARAGYNLSKQWQVFARFDNVLRAFHDSQEHGTDRLIFQQRRAEVGVKWEPQPFLTLTLSGGIAFSQEFDVGFDTRNMKRIATPSDEPYVRFSLILRP